jgi:hypothetical protein
MKTYWLYGRITDTPTELYTYIEVQFDNNYAMQRALYFQNTGKYFDVHVREFSNSIIKDRKPPQFETDIPLTVIDSNGVLVN